MTSPGYAPRWRWRKRRRARRSGLGAWVRKNLFATPVDSVLDHPGGIWRSRWALPQILELGCSSTPQWSGADRTACLTTDQGGQLPVGWSGACWAFVSGKFGQFMFGRYPVEERWRVDPDRHHLRRAAGAAADPARALQAAERDPVLRGLPVRRLLPAGRRRLRPALCRDLAVGRPAGDAGDLLCRHRRVAAARHPAGARPALEDADRSRCCR